MMSSKVETIGTKQIVEDQQVNKLTGLELDQQVKLDREADQQEVKLSKLSKSKGCRGKHFSIHSPHLELQYCKVCDSYVQLKDGNVCQCCSKVIPTKSNGAWLNKVLKFGVRQHHNFIRDWCMFPTREPVWLEIYYRRTVYEIPVKYLALSLETNDGSITDKNGKTLVRGGEAAKLKLIRKSVGIKGLRIRIPEEEEMDMKCNRCGNRLKYDKKDNIFCPECDRE